MAGNQPVSRTGFWSRRGLLAAASGGAMAEAALLVVLAPAARSLAPQVTALPPLAVFHDLRWLYAFGGPWPVFTLLVAAFLAVRTAWAAALARLAWPAGKPPPPARVVLGSCLTVTAVSALLLSPVATLMFGVAEVPFSWPFLASLATMLLVAIPLSHGGAARSWWQRLPPAATAGWLLADFIALSAAAAVTGSLPQAAAVPVAGLAGLVNARAWYGLTTAVTRPRPARARPQAAVALPQAAAARPGGPWARSGRPAGPAEPAARTLAGPAWHMPLAPVAAAMTLALVVGIIWLAFVAGMHGIGAAAGPGSGRGPAATRPAGNAGRGQPPGSRLTGSAGHARPVLEIAGFGLSCCSRGAELRQMLPGRLVQQFSYLGMARGGRPIPHGPAASNLSLTVLGNRVAAQVWRLHAETGQPVDVVAESEGTLGVDAMLAQHPRIPLGSVVLLSPILTPGEGGHESLGGPGMRSVAGMELRAVVWFVGGLSPFGTSGAETFIDSVGSHGARFAAAARSRLGRSLQFLPLADAVTLPACNLPPNVQVVPALHGELLGDPAVLARARNFLVHRRERPETGLRATAELVASVATAWRIPQAGYPSPPCGR